MTAELKNRGTKTPHIFLPFRSRVDDAKLNLFLRRVFPGGNMVDTTNKTIVRSLLSDFDEFTLICGLKYLWCRLPNNEIIGWPVYLEFKRREQEAGYPKDAFLSIMPKCLSSSSHASIVYDFLDLLISIASNTQFNHINGRKVSKMASIWAFKSVPASSSAFYDATIVKEANFLEGLDAWKQTCNGLFHLLLSFLRAMLPDTEAEALNLPTTLQSLLVSNTYPPPENGSSVKSVITIPCVHIRSTRKSADPYELISKVRHTLSFEKKDAFLSIENFTILKNIFQKSSTAEIVSTLSEESRRVLSRLTADPVPSEFDLYPGWARELTSSQEPNIPLYSEVTISSVSLQDYFIWTWLSSLGSDQTTSIKSLFGRSIVVEAGLRGFQKWMVLTETTIPPDEYISIFKNPQHNMDVDHYSRSPQISPLPKSAKEVPPLPKTNTVSVSVSLKPKHSLPVGPRRKKSDKLPPTPHESPLPDLSFSNDQFSFEDDDFSRYGTPKEHFPSPELNSVLSKTFSDKVVITPKKMLNRPRPPPLDLPQEMPKTRKTKNELPPAPVTEPSGRENNEGTIPTELEEYYLYYAPTSREDVSQRQFEEPFESYNTPFDEEQQNVSLEPFDNYRVPGETMVKELKSFGDKRINSEFEKSHEKHLPPINVRNGGGGESDVKSLPKSPYPEDEIEYDDHTGIQQKGMDFGNTEDTGTIRRYTENEEFSGSPPPNVKYPIETPYPTPYPTDMGTQPLFSENTHENSDGHSPYVDQSPAMPDNTGYPFYENAEKKKKKKKKLKKKELAAKLANIPDGPPPPLPSDGEALFPSNQTALNGLENDRYLYQGNEEFGQLIEHQGYGEVHDAYYDYVPEPELLAPTSHIRVNEEGNPPETNSEKQTIKDKQRKKPRSPYLEHPQVSQSPQYSPNPSFQPATHLHDEYPQETYSASVHHHENDMYADSKPQAQYTGLGLGIEELLGHINGAYQSKSRQISPGYEHHDDHSFQRGHIEPSRNEYPNSRVASNSHPPVEPNYPQAQTSNVSGGWQPPIQGQLRNHGSDKSRRGEEKREKGLRVDRAGPVMKNEPNVNQRIPRDHGPPQPMIALPISGLQTPVHHMAPHHAPVNYNSPQPMMVQQTHAPVGKPINIHPQYYYPPPPQGYYPPPPPQSYGHPPPQSYGQVQAPVMYYPPPGGYYPPPPPQQKASAPTKSKPSTSELAMMNMPTANAFKKNSKPNKANLRAALNQGGFGI